MNVPKAIVDFESRSACSIKNSGSWKYSLDPTTQILCLAFHLPKYQPEQVHLWHPAFPALGIAEEGQDALAHLFDWILYEGLVEAHNAWFERGIWTNICVPKLGWPVIQSGQWRCSAAKAAAYALPRGLEDATKALKLSIQKDTEGEKAMKKMMKPRKPRKAERETWLRDHASVADMPLLWWESTELLTTVCSYCQQDVRAEKALSDSLDDLSLQETQIYLLDQEINQRGFGLDSEAIERALELIAEEERTLLQEFRAITKGYPESPKQRAHLMLWLESRGLKIPNTQKATIDEYLQSYQLQDEAADPELKRVLEILRQLGASSTAKYQKMQDWQCPDGRAHGGMLYHGASTGRWSGSGIQPHNFPKGEVKLVTKDMEAAWDTLLHKTKHEIQTDFQASVMASLSSALRGAIVPRLGHQLFVADYAGIEARVLFWLAQDEDALGMFHRNKDIYCSMAQSIYGYACNKLEHPAERAIGKIAVLGLGYQMGVGKFVDTAAAGGVTIDEEFSQQVVDAYRTRFHRVKSMWYAQERAAIEATQEAGLDIVEGRMRWERQIDRKRKTDFLFCYLPSGRRLAYANPQVKAQENRWGTVKDTLSFQAVNPTTKQWQRQTTYGGMIVENETQAVARDIMAEALLRCSESKVYTPVLSVHDEIVSEAHPLLGDIQEFESLLTVLPDWASGCPVAAEGFVGLRYRK